MTQRTEAPSRPGVEPRASRSNVQLRNFSSSLPMALLRAREAVMRHFRASLREYNITEQQWRVLRALTTVEQIEVTDLARATYLLSPSLSRILRHLEQEQYITRHTVASDQRRSVVAIAPRGLDLIAVVSPDSESIYGRIADLYGAEKLGLLQDMLRELEAVMNQHNIRAGLTEADLSDAGD